MSGQQHCFVEAGGCFGGGERVKEREDRVNGAEEQKGEELHILSAAVNPDIGQSSFYTDPHPRLTRQYVYLCFQLV